MVTKLMLTRAQLDAFLPDPGAIKQFEKLFGEVDELAVIGADGLHLLASLAGLKAQNAIDVAAKVLEIAQHAAHRPSPMHNSISTDYIDFPLDGPHVSRERRVQWNKDDGTMDVGLFNGVVLQVGQEIHYYAKNTSGVLITNGSSVMATGALGASGKITIAKAVADGTIVGDYMLGIATQDIADGAFGYVTAYGQVRGIDTTGTPYGEVWADGDVIYFSPTTAGGLTKVEPAAPKLRMKMAIVTNAGPAGSGSLYVRSKTGETLAGLNDVYAPSPITNRSVLQWIAANARWEAVTLLQGVTFGKDGTDYSYFEDADGTLVFKGAATVWRDIDFPIVIRTAGANIPALVAVQGNITAPQWQINDYNVCEGQEMVHEWKEASQSQWHVHMVTNGLDATDRYVKWEVEWFWINNGGSISATTTDSAEILIPANTTTKSMIIGQISTPTLAGGKIGSHVWARLRRVALTTPGRTDPTNNPWCGMLQMHIECDTVGSRTMTAK